MLRLDKFIKVLMDSSESSEPFFVDFNAIGGKLTTLEVNSTIEISKDLLEFLRFVAAHEPYKYVY